MPGESYPVERGFVPGGFRKNVPNYAAQVLRIWVRVRASSETDRPHSNSYGTQKRLPRWYRPLRDTRPQELITSKLTFETRTVTDRMQTNRIPEYISYDI
jgi:hypothetical protein